MRVITVLNRKGGVGKTASTEAIGAGLAHRGYRVLFIDLDSQHNLSGDLGAERSRYSSMDLLTGRAPAQSCIQHKDKWDLIPGSVALDTANMVLTGNGKEYRLRDALEPIKGLYDFCMIDTPAALGILTTNALTASDGAIIPAEAETHSIQGMGLLYPTIREVQQHSNPKLRIYGILLTRYKGTAVLPKDMRSNAEAVAAQMGTGVFSKPIRESIRIGEAVAKHEDIFTYSSRSNPAQDYSAAIEELLQMIKEGTNNGKH